MNDSGVYTKQQLVAIGFDDRMIERMLAGGDLVRLRPWWFAARLRDETTASADRDGGVLNCVDALQFDGLWVPPGHVRRLHLRRGKHKTGKNKACRITVRSEPSANHAVDPKGRSPFGPRIRPDFLGRSHPGVR
ncbi:hypothetical protein [Gordonia humi]|uniref:hypothetical protein n=1 Tax=Gordonia humi TaxID=686429 RepID=UPI0031EAF694